MYNKIFTKILDSSIWLEPDSTRIVWLTCIAAMDEDGFCCFASPANLARRANVSLDACLTALATLEGPDPNSGDPANEGRRLERVPGGWVVLNAAKYREVVTRASQREHTKLRVRRHREKSQTVTDRNAVVTDAPLHIVTRNASEAYTEAEDPPTPLQGVVEEATDALRRVDIDLLAADETLQRAAVFLDEYPAIYARSRNGARYTVKEARDFPTAVELVTAYPDPGHLESMLRLFLLKKDFAPKNQPGSPRQFAFMAPQCDALLREAQWRQS